MVQQQQKQSTKALTHYLSSFDFLSHQLSSRSSSSSPYAVGIEGPIVDQQVEEERPWHSCVIQFSLDLVSLFSLIYIVVCSTPTTTIFSIYFLMQPSAVANKMKRVFFGSTSGQCRLESRRKKNRIPAASQEQTKKNESTIKLMNWRELPTVSIIHYDIQQSACAYYFDETIF